MADENKKPKLDSKFTQWWARVKFKTKNFWTKVLDKIRKLFNWIISIDIDFVFVFAASYILITPYIWWARLLFSIGITYIYKLVIKDVIRIKAIVRGK